MKPMQVFVEELEGGGFIRLSSDVLKRLGVGLGDSLYLLESYVGNHRTLVFSKTPRIPDRTDGMLDEPLVLSEAGRSVSVASLKGVIAKPCVPVEIEEMGPSWSSLRDLPKADTDFLKERHETVPAGSAVDLLTCPEQEEVEFEPNILRVKSTKE